MKSYIKVHLDEDTVKRVTLGEQLESLTSTSNEIQQKMISILRKLEMSQEDYVKTLTYHMENGKNQMVDSNREVLSRMNKIERNLEKSTKSMEDTLKNRLDILKQEVRDTLFKARKQTLINHWIDALKYGLSTAICIVPVYFAIKSIFGV
jgi:DNA anti-recombination protein RmuC